MSEEKKRLPRWNGGAPLCSATNCPWHKTEGNLPSRCDVTGATSIHGDDCVPERLVRHMPLDYSWEPPPNVALVVPKVGYAEE